MGRCALLTAPFLSAGKRSLGIAVRAAYPDLASKMTYVDLEGKSIKDLKRGKQGAAQLSEVVARNGWDRPNFIVSRAKKKVLVLNMDAVKEAAERPDSIVYLDLPVELAAQLVNNPYLQGTDLATIFLSPLTKDELFLCRPADNDPKFFDTWKAQIATYLKERFRIGVELKGWREISKTHRFFKTGRFMTLRALMIAPGFDHILPVYDADNSPNWDPKKLSGSAARTVRSVAAILRGKKPEYSEKWLPDIFKQPA